MQIGNIIWGIVAHRECSMLFLKSTSVSKAFGIFLATDPDHPPHALLGQLKVLGFENTYSSAYLHKDQGKVLDLHFQKDCTDIFKGWKTDECTHNLAAITALFEEHGITITPRVMSMAEAYA